MKEQALIIGATGKTGRPVVEQALAAGFRVRAVVRREDERSQRLRHAGAETQVGDVHDLASLRALLDGIDRVYFAYPTHVDGLVEATANLAIVAREARVRGIVNMSQIIARDGARSPLTQHHWVSELLLDHADVGAVHIRPTYFMENLLLLNAQNIANEGKIYLPYGNRAHAPIAARDIARCVVALLRRPGDLAGQRLLLTGPELLRIEQMASLLSEQLDKPVAYVDLPVDHWYAALTEQVGLPEFLAEHLRQVAIDHQHGLFEKQTQTVTEITGNSAQTLREFVKEHLAQFQGREPVFLGV
jgi:uncharacterized protein YbjT (DUF2867 family)